MVFRRLLRRNYGIAVRRVGVRSELGWPLKFLSWLGLLSVSFVVAGWVFDAGRRVAGFDREEHERERRAATERIAVLEQRLADAIGSARAAEGGLNVEMASTAQLARQLRVLERENLSLREELALFEGLVSGGQQVPDSTIQVPRVSVDVVEVGRYRYRLMLVHRPPQKSMREFQGEFRFEFKVKSSGRESVVVVPGPQDERRGAHKLNFRHLHRVEGEFSLPGGAEIMGGEVSILQNGRVLARQAVSL